MNDPSCKTITLSGHPCGAVDAHVGDCPDNDLFDEFHPHGRELVALRRVATELQRFAGEIDGITSPAFADDLQDAIGVTNFRVLTHRSAEASRALSRWRAEAGT